MARLPQSRFSSGDSSGSALTSELTPGNSDEDYLIRCTRRDSSCPVETLTHGGKVKSVCEENPSWWAGCVHLLDRSVIQFISARMKSTNEAIDKVPIKF